MPKISALPPYPGELPPSARTAVSVGSTTYQAFVSNGGNGAVITPEQFGAVGDGITDDTQAIFDAVDYFAAGGAVRQQGGEIYLAKGYAISDTVEIESLGVTLRGTGWGNSSRPQTGSYLKWIGSAGSPMLRFKQTIGAGAEQLRFIGNSAAKPSCAIEFQDVATDLLFCNHLSRIWIGNLSGYDTDFTNPQFTKGIVASGDINGDSNLFEQIRISNCAEIGVDIQNPNFSVTHFNGLYITFCPIGVKVKSASIIGTNWFLSRATDSCFVFDTAGFIQISEMAAENNNRLLRYEDGTATTKIIVNGGSFQVHTDTFAADGYMIDAGNTDVCLIDLRSFTIQRATVPPYSGPDPKIRAYKASGGVSTHSVWLRGVKGIGPNNLEFGTLVGANDSRNIVFEPALDRGTQFYPRQQMHYDWTNADDRSWQSWRNDFAGKLNDFGGPLNVRKLAPPITPAASALSGSGATTYSYRVTALTWDGETQATAAFTCTNAASLDVDHVNRLVWSPVMGARGYKIYGRSSGSEALIHTLAYDDTVDRPSGAPATPYWDDDGSVSPSGAFPTLNTTGNAVVEGRLKVGVFTVANLPVGTAGDAAFASNGRKNGEGAAAGTGVLVFHDGTAWRASDTGATVAA